ncbi:cytochrome c maturation protein CcmE [Candidatus Kirkpatrickella diaphorinae]|uniref:Cytochrome c-type biogenesis protein CcmE n=1 Tax=Candidatus Kirkpatrickella diaphorinae TaxID=2984322 RepID=A0ABY6GH27_9PROT|nr:cytochrome c maturation protein CcmE [Candidatus Kirkpatrickella diaphorinae]UYH50604.1 cytochrome c maturation protein CcmE [Candidatus Kirkpatrickella diaphorinae]
MSERDAPYQGRSPRQRRRYARKSHRLWIMLLCLICLAAASALILRAFSSNIVFFMAPSQALEHPPRPDQSIRLGGMVVAGSLKRYVGPDATPVNQFAVTDGQKAVTVIYCGVLPDLFREGQSVIAIGEMTADKNLQASEVLAKHDETYMPKEVAEALRKSGKWDPRFGKPPRAEEWDTMTESQARKSIAQAEHASH